MNQEGNISASVRNWLLFALVAVANVVAVAIYSQSIKSDIRDVKTRMEGHFENGALHLPLMQRDSPYASNERVDALQENVETLERAFEKEFYYKRNWMHKISKSMEEQKAILQSVAKQNNFGQSSPLTKP